MTTVVSIVMTNIVYGIGRDRCCLTLVRDRLAIGTDGLGRPEMLMALMRLLISLAVLPPPALLVTPVLSVTRLPSILTYDNMGRNRWNLGPIA